MKYNTAISRELPKRVYGKTGVQMPILALGGAGVLQDMSRKRDAIEIIRERELFRYALSFPIHTAVILPNSLRELRELMQAAREFTPMPPAARSALEERGKPLVNQVAGMYHQWS